MAKKLEIREAQYTTEPAGWHIRRGAYRFEFVSSYDSWHGKSDALKRMALAKK